MGQQFMPIRKAEDTPHVLAFRAAVADQGKPIVLRLSMAIDKGRKPKGIAASKDFFLVTLGSTADYVDIRREMKRTHDVTLPSRIKVAHGEDLMTHDEFAIDHDPKKLKQLYDALRTGEFEVGADGHQTALAKGTPRFFQFNRYNFDATAVIKGRSRERVRCAVGDIDDEFVKFVMKEELHLRGDTEQLRGMAVHEFGVYVIGRPRVNILTARQLQTEFEAAHANRRRGRDQWLEVDFNVYNAGQMDLRPTRYDTLEIHELKQRREPANATSPKREPDLFDQVEPKKETEQNQLGLF
jgi:hypothetical protein